MPFFTFVFDQFFQTLPPRKTKAGRTALKHTAQMITVWIQAAFRLSYSIACVIVDLLSAQIRNDSLPLSETKSDAIP